MRTNGQTVDLVKSCIIIHLDQGKGTADWLALAVRTYTDLVMSPSISSHKRNEVNQQPSYNASISIHSYTDYRVTSRITKGSSLEMERFPLAKAALSCLSGWKCSNKGEMNLSVLERHLQSLKGLRVSRGLSAIQTLTEILVRAWQLRLVLLAGNTVRV